MSAKGASIPTNPLLHLQCHFVQGHGLLYILHDLMQFGFELTLTAAVMVGTMSADEETWPAYLQNCWTAFT